MRPFNNNFSFTFHFAVVSIMSVVYVIWYEGHIMSAHSLAMLFTCLSLLPHIFALATLVYHILRRIHFFRTKCERLSEIISTKFRQSQADITTRQTSELLSLQNTFRNALKPSLFKYTMYYDAVSELVQTPSFVCSCES